MSKSSAALTMAQLRSLPKVELHRHLDCSMRWSTMVELAPQVGIELPADPTARRDHFLVTSPMRDLDSVLRKFLCAQKVLASEEILARLALEACEDAFNDGILVLELRYAPTFIAEGHAKLDFEKIHRAFIKGIDEARRRLPMAVGLIGTIQRIKPVAEAARVADFIVDHKDEFIGIDLADNEEGFDPKPFAPMFLKAKKAGVHVTVHSGEAPHDTAARWVRDSVEILGAERVGHGIQIVRDEKVIEFVRANGIPLEVCPLSNDLTQAFPTPSDHPIRRLLEAGVKITINADDPGVFATTLTDDYEWLQRVHGFTPADFALANEVAREASFLPKTEIDRIWPRKAEERGHHAP